MAAIEQGFANFVLRRQQQAAEDDVRRAQYDGQRATEAQRQHEEALGRDLRNLATRWTEARSIREFLAALDAALSGGTRRPGFEEWLDWARSFAAELDPLSTPERVAKVLRPSREESAS